ncbi:Uncharacterised protein [Plesiomonas shigelloides]|uniref:hypothetical protein n=1 Tax=Plesiomonas shigelloides TaxID=703 RepID=UPI000E01E99A|nr:hypothetical protein [Plesiomonas shigelloides]SUB64946.1 Uncharacterised protein [Plesiomonas shigelloides]
MEKKSRPEQAQWAAKVEISNADKLGMAVQTDRPNSTFATSIAQTKPAPKKHRARVYMLRSGANGWTENGILRNCRLSSGRNYASELERTLGIHLLRTTEQNHDGIGSHLRYQFACRSDVLRVIHLVNHKATAGGYQGLSRAEIDYILTLYPDTHPHTSNAA